MPNQRENVTVKISNTVQRPVPTRSPRARGTTDLAIERRHVGGIALGIVVSILAIVVAVVFFLWSDWTLYNKGSHVVMTRTEEQGLRARPEKRQHANALLQIERKDQIIAGLRDELVKLRQDLIRKDSTAGLSLELRHALLMTANQLPTNTLLRRTVTATGRRLRVGLGECGEQACFKLFQMDSDFNAERPYSRWVMTQAGDPEPRELTPRNELPKELRNEGVLWLEVGCQYNWASLGGDLHVSINVVDTDAGEATVWLVASGDSWPVVPALAGGAMAPVGKIEGPRCGYVNLDEE